MDLWWSGRSDLDSKNDDVRLSDKPPRALNQIFENTNGPAGSSVGINSIGGAPNGDNVVAGGGNGSAD